MKKIAVIMGARPNFVKAAPFFQRAKNYPEFDFTIIHTGQHFDENMSKIFFDEMQIPKPDIMLDIKGEFHTEKIGRTFDALKKVFKGNDFHAAIVFGDVNSTLAGALAAAKNNCHLIHIEAGLRSHDRRMPEEINRVIVDHLSDLLFTTEPAANENLAREGIREEKIKYVGNIMIESLEIFRDKIESSNILEALALSPKEYVLATVHRQENTDDKTVLERILSILKRINERVKVVFPLHPGTRKKIDFYALNQHLENMRIIEPLGYFEFAKLMSQSRGVITDSGGIQEETTHLGVPCATLRDNTERPVTLEKGSNSLFAIDLGNVNGILEHLSRKDFSSKPVPLWDEDVSDRILRSLKEYFGEN